MCQTKGNSFIDNYLTSLKLIKNILRFNVNNKCMIELPYAMKLMIQELQTMCINTRLITETKVTNKPVFDYLRNNYNSGKNIDDIYDEEIDDDLYDED